MIFACMLSFNPGKFQIKYFEKGVQVDLKKRENDENIPPSMVFFNLTVF